MANPLPEEPRPADSTARREDENSSGTLPSAKGPMLPAGDDGEAKFRLLADTMPQIVWITRADGYHEYYNKHWWDYTGLTYEQARGEGWNLLLHPDDLQRSIQRWQEALRTGEPYEIEYRFRRASDGVYRWFLGRALPYRDEAGQITRWFGTCTDIHAQKQAEETLRQNSARLQLVLEAGRLAAWEMDLVTGAVSVSDTMGPLLGQPPGVRCKRVEDWSVLIHPDDRKEVLASFHQAIAARGTYQAEYRVIGADDKIRWIESHGQVLLSAEGKPVKIAGVAADITDRKHAEGKFAEAARRTRVIIESITDAFFSLDRDWRFTYVNDQAARLLQRPARELLGRGIWTEFPRAVGSTFELEYRCAVETNEPVSFEEFYPPLNAWFEVHAYPSPEGLSVYFHDITARKRDEEALRIGRQRMNLVLEGADVGLWYCPLPLDRMEWDHRVKEHFWLPPDNTPVSTETFYARLHPDDREPTRLAIERAVADRVPYDIEYRTVSPVTGALKWVRATGRAFYDAEGAPARFDGITIDVTARKQSEAERENLLASERAARTEAERTSRMKDEFLANLSHELRTPLNAILGWSQVVRASHTGDAELEEGLSIIERNARVQTQLIDDLLDMSRIISGKVRLDVQQVALVGVIEAAIESVQPAADAKEIRLQAVLDPHAGPVMGDPARLQQIVWNLLSNAIKFTPRHGRVQVILERDNSHVEISVRDTGLGIKPEFLPHVFERFRQADASSTRRYGGLGLGLAIVKNLVEMHGGAIRATSPGEDQGATFRVCLPLAIVHRDESPEAARQHPKTETGVRHFDPSVNLENVKILVVDDEADGRLLVKRILEDCRASVTMAGSAEEGLGILREWRPDVLISDVGMPGQDGYQFVKKVREFAPDNGGGVAAVALTAFARSEDRRKAMLAGFDIHMAKPVEPTELIAVVARLAGRV